MPRGTRLADAARLELALAAGGLGTWEWDVPSGRVTWSRTLEQIHGLEPGAFGGTFDAFAADVHPEDRERVQTAIDESLVTGVHELLYRIVTPRGHRWVEARGRVVARNASGAPRTLIGVCSDVTERATAELRETITRRRHEFLHGATVLLAESLEYETTLKRAAELAVPHIADWCAIDLVEGASLQRVAVAHTDAEKVALAEELHRRFPPDPADPNGPHEVMRTGRSALMSHIPAAVIERGARTAEHLAILRDLDLSSAMIVPMRAHGDTLGTISFVGASGRTFDADDLQLAEQLANVAAIAVDNAIHQRELERTIAAREQVLAIVSHDLRSPLAVVVLGGQLAREAVDVGDDAGARTALARIRRASARMERLITDLLNFAAISADSLSVKLVPTDVPTLLDEARDACAEQAQLQGVAFEAFVARDAGTISCDRGRVLQVLSNLVGNAIKFTEAGGHVSLTAEAVGDEMIFTVRDTGSGIPEDVLSRVFEPYERGQTGAEGVGLGLYISRGIVRTHGGRMWVESEVGRGSTFGFALPRREP